MEMSAACVCRGHKLSVSCAASSTQVKMPRSRRNELPVETSLAQEPRTQQGERPSLNSACSDQIKMRFTLTGKKKRIHLVPEVTVSHQHVRAPEADFLRSTRSLSRRSPSRSMGPRQGQALCQTLGVPAKVSGQTDLCPHGASAPTGEGRGDARRTAQRAHQQGYGTRSSTMEKINKVKR